ncbi:MAG TPA: cation:proton antiporter [Ktedonobacterales bacterium]|jgi:Kef-type K+ transport system membrane component KefB
MSENQAISLLLFMAGAFLIPLLSKRIGLPAAACEMLYGALLGNLMPMMAQPDVFITALAHFGFILLLFLAGLEVDFVLVEHEGSRGVFRSAAFAVGVLGAGVAGAYLLGYDPIFGLLVGAISIGVVLVILRETELSRSRFGQIVLISGAIGEFLTILALTLYSLLRRYGLSLPILLAVGKLALLLLLGWLVLQILGTVVWWHPHQFRRLVASNDPAELGVRAALALMTVFAAAAVLLGVEEVLATFIAGAIFAFVFRHQGSLSDKLAAVAHGFFVPIFFINVGLGLQLSGLRNQGTLLLLLELLTASLLVRALAMPLLKLTGLGWKAACAGALLLSAPLTMQVAVAQVGVSLGVFDAGSTLSVLGASVVGAVIFPALFRPLARRLLTQPTGSARVVSGPPAAAPPLAHFSSGSLD